MEEIGTVLEKYHTNEIVTGGDFADEDDSQNAFMLAMANQRFFHVMREVSCWYYGGQPFQDNAIGRIDFVLMPRKEALDCGWRNGAIGVECKASGLKAGPVLCQAIDYAKGVFRSESTGLLFCLSAVFLWPGLSPDGGFVTSVMAQNRIGSAWRHKNEVGFSISSTGILRIKLETQTMTHRPIVSGRKSGSR